MLKQMASVLMALKGIQVLDCFEKHCKEQVAGGIYPIGISLAELMLVSILKSLIEI
jgi:hypothetical protein